MTPQSTSKLIADLRESARRSRALIEGDAVGASAKRELRCLAALAEQAATVLDAVEKDRTSGK